MCSHEIYEVCPECNPEKHAEAVKQREAKFAREELIRDMAKDEYEEEGRIELDDLADISEDAKTNGAYVQAWVWVDFSGTELDKEENND